MDADFVGKLLLWALAFIFSTTFHEAAHAWVALKGGDTTAYAGGQVTMNPIPHIRRSPIGMVVAPILFFALSGFMVGWASVPYNRIWAERHPHRAAVMSLAGPAANFALALFAFGCIKIGLATEIFTSASGGTIYIGSASGEVWTTVGNLLSILFTLNLILFLFNLLPLPPLDGAEGILIFFPEERAAAIREKMRAIGIFGLFIAWMIFPRIAGPFLNLAWGLVN